MKTIPIRRITTARKVQDIAGRFSIRDIQNILKGNDLVHELHKHDFFFILALKEGQGIHAIDFMNYEIHDCSIFFLRPGQVHRLELKAKSMGFLMEFDPSFYHPKNTTTEQVWKKAASKNFCRVEKEKFMKLHSILANLFYEFTGREEGYIEAIKSNLDLFFIEYARQSKNQKATSQSDSGYTQDRFEELLHLLEMNIRTMKNAAQYAELLNLSSYQVNAITKSSVGKTVSGLINEQILLEAKRYLLATTNQVKDIADHLGYEDPSYFIRFFRKHTGHSPEAFRKKFK